MTAFRAECIEADCPFVGPIRSDGRGPIAAGRDAVEIVDDPEAAADEDAHDHIEETDHGAKVLKIVQA